MQAHRSLSFFEIVLVTHCLVPQFSFCFISNPTCVGFLKQPLTFQPTVILSVALLFCYHITLFSFQGAGFRS